MTHPWRISALADKHRALGSELEEWNGMGTAWTYSAPLREAYEAIRTRAGLMDVSGLKKVHYIGPHAEALLQEVVTRDVRLLYPGKCVYATMLNDAGKFIDDCIVYRVSPNAWFVVHGGGAGYEALTRASIGKDVTVLFDDDLHDLSLQGPLAVEFLADHVPGISELRYFHHLQTQIFGAPVMISRTGYTGERGYEIFCKAQDAPMIWDRILELGAPLGIVPCAFTALDWLRVESFLLFYPYDNSEMYPFADEAAGDTLWELGLDFTVTSGKTNFRGATEHRRLEGKERFKIFGVEIESAEAATEGDTVWSGETQVGVITCAMYSHLNGWSMAIARLDPSVAVHGTALEVRGSVTAPARATTLPVDDPERAKRTAKD